MKCHHCCHPPGKMFLPTEKKSLKKYLSDICDDNCSSSIILFYLMLPMPICMRFLGFISFLIFSNHRAV